MTSGDPAVIGRRGSYAKGIARRQEILDRAIEVFQERGADGTSLRRIAEAIGVSHAALLHYFDSREQLLVAVYEHAEAKRGREDADPSETSAADTMVVAATRNVKVPGLVELYSTLVAAALESGSEHSRAFFTARFEGLRADLARRLREEQAEGKVRRDVDPELIAAIIIAASDGLQIQWLLDPSVELERALGTFATLLAP